MNKYLDLNKVKKIGIVIAAIFVLGLGIAIGSAVSGGGAKHSNTPIQAVTLDNGKVNNFLMQYYTKKELTENRNRYKPLMTDQMYNQATNIEDQPVNQAYKGYIVDQVFQDSTNYIDENDLTALCVVHYTNTQLSKLGDMSSALKNVSNTDKVLLTFTKNGNQYLVSNVQMVTFDIPGVSQDSNAYQSDNTSSSTSQSNTLAGNSQVTINGNGVSQSSSQPK